MRVIRSINHNAAIGVDSLGREVVVLGSGVGFGTIPWDIRDGGFCPTAGTEASVPNVPECPGR